MCSYEISSLGNDVGDIGEGDLSNLLTLVESEGTLLHHHSVSS